MFGWISSKLKKIQLQRELIKSNAENMTIIDGLSILNPNWRISFGRFPFYDNETDTLDLQALYNYIFDLHFKNDKYHTNECETCHYYAEKWNEARFSLEFSQLDYSERVELEHLRELFMILTGEEVYYHTSDFRNLKKIIKDYRDQYRNLDETISNFENKIYQKNEEIERLHQKLDKIKSKPVKAIEKEPSKDERPITRNSKIYHKFKINVLKRDKVCQCCGSTHDLHVHHLSSYRYDKSKRADPSNGIVLCSKCHTEYHSQYGKSHKNNPVNFAKFMREYSSPTQINLDYNLNENNATHIIGGK